MPVQERHRTTLACARCYQMKKKCDKKTPSCSRCVQARQPCIGINRQNDAVVPRSVVQFLEQVLNKLDNTLSNEVSLSVAAVAAGLDDPNFRLFSPEVTTSNLQDYYSSVVKIATRAVAPVFTSSLLWSQPGLYHRNRLFYGSETPPLKVHVNTHQKDPYRITGIFSVSKVPIPETVLVPSEVAARLLNVYIENILPRYPCYAESDLKQHFEAVYPEVIEQEPDPRSEMSRFIVFMVLAISCLTSRAHDFHKVASLSESLHRAALRHSQFLQYSNTDTLRCFLLLIQLALILPHTGNLWYMTGEAMRMAIALGFHQEPVESYDSALVDLRQRIFWTTYILERTVSITSGCPVAISDEHIKVALPYGHEGKPFGVNDSNSDRLQRRMRTQFLNVIRLRQLQTQIHAVRFFGHQLPDSMLDYDEWMKSVDKKITTWRDQVSSSHRAAPDWFTNAANVTRLMLYRPRSIDPIPSDKLILEIVEIAIDIVHGCWKLSQTGYLKFPFHNVYNGFHAGLVILYAIKHHSESYHSWDAYEHVVNSLSLLTKLFSTLGVIWPAAIDTGRYFNELKLGVLRSLDSTCNPGDSPEDINLIAEIDHLVTERKPSGIYHQSSQSAESTSSPEWMHVQQFQFSRDETWEDFMSLGFGLENVDSLYISDEFNNLASSSPILECPGAPSSLMESIDESLSSEKLEKVIESIPACSYCRNRRVKCNRTLPMCRICADYGKPCVYFDSILSTDITGSYLYTLYTSVRDRMDQRRIGGTLMPSNTNDSAIPAKGAITGCPRNVFLPNHQRVNLSPLGGRNKDANIFNVDNLFFGSSSCISVLDLTASMRPGWMPSSGAVNIDSSRFTLEIPDTGLSLQEITLPPYSVAVALVDLFSRSINTFYPTMHQEALEELLLIAYDEPHKIHGTFEEQTLYIILAISSQVTRRNDRSLGFTSEAYFRKGVSEDAVMHERTGKSQLLLLQRTLLTCIYLLFSPGSGDLWRNLGFSIRVYFDMVHRPSDAEGKQELAVMLYRTLYCLECQVALAYGRPSLLAICDILRDNMLTSISGSVTERLSIYFYRVSFLKLQILNETLPGPTKEREQPSLGHDSSWLRRQELQTWYDEWSREVELASIPEGHIQEVSASQLKAWGQLNYYETLLFISRTQRSQAVSSEENDQACEQFVQACTTLTRHHTTASLLTAWTATYSLFAANLSLFQRKRPDMTTTGTSYRSTILRRCLTLMATLEANLNNMATGFTEILESFCSNEEHLS